MKDNENRQNEETIMSKLRVLLSIIASSRRNTVIAALAATVLFVLVVLILASSGGASGSGTNHSTFTVRRDDLVITVTENGSIRARNTIDLKCEVEGQTTIISIVPEGIYITEEDVKNGKVLVELDSSNLREQLTLREIDFASTQASYADANEAYLIRVKQNESDVTSADLALRFAKMDFNKYLGDSLAEELIASPQRRDTGLDVTPLINDPNNLGGAARQRLNELDDSITLAEETLIRSENKLQSTERLYDANYVSRFELQGDMLAVKSNRVKLEQAQTDLRLFKLYDFAKNTETYLSDYREAGRELDRTEARARALLAQAEAKLQGAQSQYGLQKDRVEKLRRQINACIMRAPAPGIVVYSSSQDWRRRRDRTIEEGGTVMERQSIISLPDTSEMMVEIDVHESSVDKVRPGQSAKITIDAFPDQSFQGKVLKVAPLPDPQRGWLNPDLKVYTTEVTIEGSHSSLKPGMSAKVEVLVEQLDDVVIVPVQVVANREGRKVCYCLASGRIEEREVRTGTFNNTFVQITDGLQVGEEVLMNPPRLVGPTVVTRAKDRPGQREEIAVEPRRERAEGGRPRGRPTERAQERERQQGSGSNFAGMGQLQNLSPEQREQMKQRLESMSDEEREKFMAKMRERFNQQGRPEQD